METPKISQIEEILLVLTCALLMLVCSWALYEGWATAEVPRQGPGDATMTNRPFTYWLTMASYGAGTLFFAAVVAFRLCRIARRLAL